jgi:hypothetical protein
MQKRSPTMTLPEQGSEQTTLDESQPAFQLLMKMFRAGVLMSCRLHCPRNADFLWGIGEYQV